MSLSVRLEAATLRDESEAKHVYSAMGESTDYVAPEQHGMAVGSVGPDCRRPLCVATRSRLQEQAEALRLERDQLRLAQAAPKASDQASVALVQELELSRQQMEKIRLLEQQVAARDAELTANRWTIERLRADAMELEQQLQDERNAHRDCRNSYAVLQQEMAQQRRQRHDNNVNGVAEGNVLRRQQRNWVPGCEKYGIGVDEPG